MSRPQSSPGWIRIVGVFLLALLLAALLAGLAWLALGAGFAELREYRQLERTPRSLVAAVLPGEVNLSGRVVPAGPLLQAPDSGVEVVYYRYHVERESRDSEGRTEWRTVLDESEYVDFMLVDDSGEILVQPGSRVRFDVPQRSQRRHGDMRYTEYRLQPADQVFVFGHIDARGRAPRVEFETPGQYWPVISTYGAESVHGGMMLATLLWLWFGLLLVSAAIYALLWGLRVHVSTVYLAILSIVMAAALVGLSVRAARVDLRDSFARTARDVAAAQALIGDRLTRAGLDWPGDWNRLRDPEVRLSRLAAFEQRVVEHLRDRIALQVARTEAVRRQWPERLVAGGLELPELPQIAVAPQLEHDPDRERARSGRALLGHGVAAALLVIATLLAWFGFRRVRLKRTIENLPTSRSAGVACGLAELKGRAEVAAGHEPLIGPLSSHACVWYHYLVEERRGSGRNARWVTVQDTRVDRRFRLLDDEGAMPVEPAGAETIVTCCKRERRGRMRYTERWIAPGTELYVLGSAEIDPDTGDSLQLARGPAEQPFLISDLGESELMLRKARSAFLLLNLGVNAGNGAALALLASWAAMHGAGFLAAALVPLGFFAVFLAILIYNDLVMLRQRVRRAWANIEVALLKRADLVPRLQSVLQAYLDHERGLQQQLALLRQLSDRQQIAPAAAAELIGAEQAVLGRFQALREAHPDLRGNVPASALIATLVRLETELALMRDGYNHSVERYNTRSQQFPELLFARLFRFRPAELLRSTGTPTAVAVG